MAQCVRCGETAEAYFLDVPCCWGCEMVVEDYCFDMIEAVQALSGLLQKPKAHEWVKKDNYDAHYFHYSAGTPFGSMPQKGCWEECRRCGDRRTYSIIDEQPCTG